MLEKRELRNLDKNFFGKLRTFTNVAQRGILKFTFLYSFNVTMENVLICFSQIYGRWMKQCL